MVNDRYISLFIVSFIVYAAIMVFIGWFSSRGKSTGKNYLTGGGHLPLFLIFGTMGATMIGTGSSIGATANGFKSGWAGSAYGLGAALGIIALVWAVKKARVREKNFITMAEEAQFYYDGSKEVKYVMAFMMFIIEVVWLGNHMNGGATYLAYVTNLDLNTAKLLMTAGFGIYIIIGGYLAVVWTDFIQLIIIVLGFIAITIIAVPMAGGWHEIATAYKTAGNEGALSIYGIKTMGVMALVSLIFSIAIPCLGTPTYRLRVYTAKDNKTAVKALNRSAFLLFIFSLFPAIIGMAAFTIATKTGDNYITQHPDFAFVYVATVVLGPVLGIMFMIAGLSATMSSGDSDAIAAVTILVQDIYPIFTGKQLSDRALTVWSRVATVCTLALAYFATLFAKDVMSYILNVIGSIIPGVSVAMFMGVAWKRVTWQGGLGSVLSGTLFGSCYLFINGFKSFINSIFTGPAIPATIIALTFCIVLSLISKKENIPEERRLELVQQMRGK